jgi:opacity protein-like surface antigen
MVLERCSVKRLCSILGFLAAAAISPVPTADIALAADVGYAAVEMPGNWTGFNIGTGVSAGAITTQIHGPSGTNFTMLDGEGLGGSAFMPWVTAGYNIQFGSFLAGIAANLTYDEAREHHTSPALGLVSIYAQDFGSLQLRGGYVFDNVLLYGIAGFELTKIKVSGDKLPVEDKKSNFAPLAGMGIDYAVDRSRTLLLRAEAKVYWIGEKTIEFTPGARELSESVAVFSLGFVRKY